MKLTNVDRECSMEWESFDEFKPHMEAVMKRNERARSTLYQPAIAAQRWFGAASGTELLEYVDKGWPELRKRLERMLEGIESEVPRFPTETHMRRRKRRFADSGDELIQERVWNGNLDEAWVKPTRVERLIPNQKCVTIAVDVTASAYITNDQALWRAALGFLLVNSLARAGRTLEIWITDSTGTPYDGYLSQKSPIHGVHPNKLWTAWRVKSSSEPLVMDRLVSMMSVGFMRTAGFVAMHSVPEWKVAGGYGSALNSGLPHSLRDRQSRGETVIRIGGVFSKEAALAEYSRVWQEVEAQNSEAA